jgi:DNA-binding transcriptional MerR regulator
MSLRFSIGAAAAKSGLSAHTIRAWERRYGILEPSRTGTNRRQYTEDDLRRLALLRGAVEAGHSIGQLAQLSDSELLSLAERPDPPSLVTAQQFLLTAIQAIERLDGLALDDCLNRGAAGLGLRALMADVVSPLLEGVGERWRAGTLGIAHEHLASDVVRAFLHRAASRLQNLRGGRKVLVTTPANQRHEIGALMVALAANLEGWQSIYLGPNLPAIDIAEAARQSGASAVALSIVHPDDDSGLEVELRALRAKIGTLPLLAGGRAVAAYRGVLDDVGAIILPSISDVGTVLRQI